MGMKMEVEIERKFILSDFPAEKEGLVLIGEAIAYQGYIKWKAPTVRIRSMDWGDKTTYKLNFKGQGTIAREEMEIDLTKEQFEQLSNMLPVAPIRKDYRLYELPRKTENSTKGELRPWHLECSWVDKGTKSQFCYAEVEFKSIEEANAFVPPEFLGREVTEEPYYTMSSYWSRKILPELR